MQNINIVASLCSRVGGLDLTRSEALRLVFLSSMPNIGMVNIRMSNL